MNPEILYGMTGMLAVLLGGIVVLVPVLGLTVRYALRPMIESWVKMKTNPTLESQNDLLARQVALLEAEVQHLQGTVQGLVEGQDFQRALQGEKSR